MTVKEIQDYVFNFFSNKGLPSITVCAIMGNIQGENSGWNITQEESNGGGGFGLCQWTNTTGSPRRTQLEAYGTDLQSQCEFLWSELTGENTTETGASYQWIADPPSIVDNGEGFYCSNDDFLQGNGTIDFLTTAFCYCWERPAYSTNHLESTRIPYAKTFFNRYGASQIIEDAIDWALSIANDDTHGYDQTDRWGNDYDCSSFIIQAFENAGCKVKTAGATYTGDMEKVFVECGFESIKYTSGMDLLRGDVLLRDGHTEMYIGDGKNVGAHINELGTVTGGKTGDQTGEEISITNFSSSGTWETVLRLKSSGSGGGSGGDSGGGETTSTKKRKGYNFVLFNYRRRKIWRSRKY